jgi:hypothetical protein
MPNWRITFSLRMVTNGAPSATLNTETPDLAKKLPGSERKCAPRGAKVSAKTSANTTKGAKGLVRESTFAPAPRRGLKPLQRA